MLTSELLLPVAGDLAALRLDGLLAVGAGAGALAGAQAAVALVGHADAPLPLAAVRLALLLACDQTPPGSHFWDFQRGVETRSISKTERNRVRYSIGWLFATEHT